MSAGGARRAVLIGNGVFPRADGSLTPLAAPAHDVGVLAGILSDADLCRFEAPQRLVDADATTVKKALLRALETAGPADLVVIYYAGHGKLDGAQLYLCANDTEPEALAATSISIRDIHHFVGRSACRQVVLILDCCFSGAAADEFQTRGEMVDRITAAAAPARGLYLLTSCGAYETALERGAGEEGDVPYGLYTRALVDGIVSGEADVYRDGRITPLELARYLQERIPGQTPRVTLIDAEGEEPVLAWTGWSLDDEKRGEVRERLAGWFADEVIPYDVMHEAMQLLSRVPRNAVEKRRRRLLALCTGAGWDAVFARAWRSLGDGVAPDDFERFLTQHAAEDELPERTYVEAMRLLAAEPANDVQRRLKLLLASFAREEHRDVRILLDAWRALERRRTPEPPPQPAPDASEPEPPPLAESAAPPQFIPAVVEAEAPSSASTSAALPPGPTAPEEAAAPAPDEPTPPPPEETVSWVEATEASIPPSRVVLRGASEGIHLPAAEPQSASTRRAPQPARAAKASGARGPTLATEMSAEERYARTELRFLKVFGAGVLVLLAIAVSRNFTDHSSTDTWIVPDTLGSVAAGPAVAADAVGPTAAPGDTVTAVQAGMAGTMTPDTLALPISNALLSRINWMGYEPVKELLSVYGYGADRVFTDEPDGLYYAMQNNRILLMTRGLGAAEVEWEAGHQNFLARVVFRLEEGDPDVGAGLSFRGPARVMVHSGSSARTTMSLWTHHGWRLLEPERHYTGIRSGGENLLEIAAIGDHVLIYVNGVHVATTRGLPTEAGHRIGLRVDGPGARYSFTNLLVYELAARRN